MKDSTDKATTELFPEKKGRGRPTTGSAKTGAERQATYRENKLRKAKSTPYGQKNLNIWMDAGCKWDLEKLARYYGVSPTMLLEQLIKETQAKLLKTWDYGSEEYENYFRNT